MTMPSDDIDVALIAELKGLSDRNDEEGYLARLNSALAEVVTEDNGEPLIKLSAETLGPRVHLWLVGLGVPADEAERLHLRAGVVQRLRAASETLPYGYTLIVRDAFRSARTIWALYDLYVQRLRERQPELTDHERDISVRNLLAMPDDSVPPGHMTGGAVDVNLGDNQGRRLDLEVPESTMSRKLQAPTFCPGLPSEVVARREILYQVLTGAGFHNYFREYWHYSFGDAYWAVRRVNKVAIYGIPGNGGRAGELSSHADESAAIPPPARPSR
jgi:D-alanyl-D-alanine dipeptidase